MRQTKAERITILGAAAQDYRAAQREGAKHATEAEKSEGHAIARKAAQVCRNIDSGAKRVTIADITGAIQDFNQAQAIFEEASARAEVTGQRQNTTLENAEKASEEKPSPKGQRIEGAQATKTWRGFVWSHLSDVRKAVQVWPLSDSHLIGRYKDIEGTVYHFERKPGSADLLIIIPAGISGDEAAALWLEDQPALTARFVEHGVMYHLTMTARPAVIQFADLLAAVKWERDEYPDAPGENDDIYTHDRTPAHQIDDYAKTGQGSSYARGFVCPDRDPNFVITIAPETAQLWGIAPPPRWSGKERPNHQEGAARQVWAQMAAANIGRTIDHIAGWYNDQWEFLNCTLEHEDVDGFYVGGYESSDPAYIASVAREAAAEVAEQLRAQGYIVEGQEDDAAALKLWELRRQHAENVAAQNMPAFDVLRARRRHAARMAAKNRIKPRERRRQARAI